MYQSLSNFLKKIRTGKQKKRIADILTAAAGEVRVVIEGDAESESMRLFLAPQKPGKVRARKGGLADECAGVVIEYPSLRVLALPPPPTTDKYRSNFIIENFDSYTVEYAVDGTLVTAYWYDGGWRLSSTNGYDVTDMQWIGPRTYMELLTGIVGASFFDGLNKNNSYTIIFHTPEFHPVDPTPAAVSICSVDLAKYNDSYEYVTVPNPLPGPRVYVPLNGPTPAKKYRSIVNICTNSLSSYIRMDVSPVYGFILRPATCSLPTILIRSELGKFLRDTIYNVPKTAPLAAENRLNYMILRAWLSYQHRFTLAQLMPEKTAPLYKQYDKMVKKIANLIMTPDEGQQPENIFANALASKMRSNGIQTNSLDPGTESQICDYLTNINYVGEYLAFL